MKPPPTLEHVYAETRGCVADLRAAGFGAAAEGLERALYGATSGEALDLVCGGARGALRARPGPSPALRDRLEALARDARRVLRGR